MKRLLLAVARSGGTGSQAVENDLEISGFEVYDQYGRHLSNQFSPDYPFPARSGYDLIFGFGEVPEHG